MKKWGTLLLLATLFINNSCTDLSGIEERLENLEQSVDNTQAALDALETAYQESKVIKEIIPSQDPDGGWIITFTDGSCIEIKNGSKGSGGITPYMLIDQDGYWCVSYDGGKTFTRIMDESGEYIKAEGSEGVSVKISTDENGYYTFLLYYASSPDEIIDTIKTPYKSDPSKIISYITKDNKNNIITITLKDGTEFQFKKDYSLPTGISVLSTSGIRLGKGTTSTIEFRVNPSNAKFNFDVDSPECEIELDLVNKTRSSYTTRPINFKLSKVELVYNEQGIVKQGQYRAYITDTEVSEDYIEDAALVLTVNNINNEKVQISSSAFKVMFSGNILTSFSFLKENNDDVIYDVNTTINGNSIAICTPSVTSTRKLTATFTTNGERVLVNNVEQISGVSVNDFSNPVEYTVISAEGEVNRYTVSVSNTGLPVVVIETPGAAAIPPKTMDWLKGTSLKIYDADGKLNYSGNDDNIRGRGNSTWTFPKKPYALKLDSKAPILGMPKHKRWVLLANWMDRTMLRNSVAFRISSSTGLEWTPRGESVEVILNGRHIGNYYLCEQIKIDGNRVNVNEMSSTDVDGDAITGGYLMELDTYFDEVNKFKSGIKNLPYMFKEPDEETLNEQQFQYMQNYINTLEESLYDDAIFATREYADYIDIDSYIDWWFVYELTQNSEPGHPKSCYMYKDKLKKMKAGPVWDFDCETFVPGKTVFCTKRSLYYGRLFEDHVFTDKVKERWNLLKPEFEKVADFIESEKNRLAKSAEINISMWPISSRINGDETMEYDEAMERMKQAYEARIEWLDNEINNM